MKRQLSVISSVMLALLLSGCASDYSVDENTKEVTVVLPKNTQNNSEITAIKTSLREEYRHTPIGVIQTGNELRVIFPSDLLFGVGNTQLQESAAIYIDMFLGAVSGKEDLTYLVEGLTDSSGSQASNLKLSEERAQSVADYLEHQGMPADNISVKGYGGLYSVADNNTKQERASNRRVVITVLLAKSRSQSKKPKAPVVKVDADKAAADNGVGANSEEP